MVLEWLSPNVFAVHLDDVERAEHGAGVRGITADEVEHGQAAVAADDRLAVDHARAHWQRLNRIGDKGEAVSEVVAVAGVKPNDVPAPMRQDAEATGALTRSSQPPPNVTPSQCVHRGYPIRRSSTCVSNISFYLSIRGTVA
jgi:hypothetical protein